MEMKTDFPTNEMEEYLPTSSISRLSNTYLSAASSDNTRKAYRSDIRHYETSGGHLPANFEMIAQYLESHASKLNPRTLKRRLIALSHWHVYQGFFDPTLHPTITKMLTGIMRLHGKPKEKAPALTPQELQQIVLTLLQENDIFSLRDNALLQIGFFGALRRSELIAIHYEHIKWEKEGIEILLPTSKTDPLLEGQYCTIPYGTSTLCPVSALKNWLAHSQITKGPIFRRLIHGQLGHNSLTPLVVNQILKMRAKAANLPNANQLSSHSLRRGLATSAAQAGAPIHVIMRAGRWKQTNTVIEYIENTQRYIENAASKIFSQLTTNEIEE